MKKISIGCDHGGFQLKQHVVNFLKSKNFEVLDLGCFNTDSVDYPDYGAKAAQAVAQGQVDAGVVICKSGVGMSIVANKVSGVRAALCLNEKMAEMSRRHNDANVICFGSEYVDEKLADQILERWLSTDFEGGRHMERVKKIKRLDDSL